MSTLILLAILVFALAAFVLLGVAGLLLFAQAVWILAWATGKAFAHLRRRAR